jgi:hypothetical protein
MLRQFFLGGFVSLCNIAVHALVMSVLIRAAQRTGERRTSPQLLLVGVMTVAVSILMIAHTCEVMVWALAYHLVDAAPPAAKLVYFAFVNYTTLGYGDVLPVESWQLLGPMTAMNGVLLFGWSTAVMFEILRRVLTRNFDISHSVGTESGQ